MKEKVVLAQSWGTVLKGVIRETNDPVHSRMVVWT
jgi:hypothetical protein